MWNFVNIESHKMPDLLADEFLKSELNDWITDDDDLKNRVQLFLEDKEEKLKHNYKSELFKVLRHQRQKEIRYSFDSY